ncbi:polar amino acid transport system permease protein [Monaibacterium marinum]|uniref:Polar amino acid transport system permease protein n=1 Tax=Pontivivens marinum TaxID=1690039 RepID=A0A2C9CTM8_9RHOB|nr:amino acid ABC transporter permease [Monaibacterium marinum]SOH94861.1 polar amino acid transport system permease protein [Monaibacterium marinum]
MNYNFQFNVVWRNFDVLLEGAWLTLQLGVFAFTAGCLIGLVGAAIRSYGPAPLRWLVNIYVIFITNTPALIQIYFLYFALPEFGIRWSNEACVLIGLTLNAGAYLTMILRAGFLSVRQAEMEAGETMGMSLPQRIRYIVVPHIAKSIYPALANFFIVILVMGTSVGALIGVDELTGQAINLSTVNYRWLEYFTVAALMYVVLTFIASIGLALLGRWAFRVKARIF